MPPYERSRCIGDFSITQPSNTDVHGFGDLSVARDVKPSRHVELAAADGTPALKTTTQALDVHAAKAMTLKTTDGSISLTPMTPATSGSFSLTAQNAGSGSLSAGSAGLTLGTANGGAMTVSCAGGYTGNAGGIYSNTAVGDATLASSAAATTVSAKTDLSMSGEVSATMSSDATASMQAPAVNVGSTDCAALTLGRDACATASLLAQDVTIGSDASTVTIPGNFIVQGNTTQVHTNETTVTDNTLVLNQAPAIQGRDSGFVLKRHALDVAQGSADLTLALSAGAASAATVLALSDASALAANWVLKIAEGATSDVVTVASVAANNVTVSPLTNSYTPAAVVTGYKSQANTLHYNEAVDEWRFGFSLNAGNSANVATEKYAPIHCQKVIVEEGFESASSATKTVSIADNAGSGAGAVIPGLKHRGTYQLLIESTANDGACASFFLSKSAAGKTSASAFMISSGLGAGGEEVSVEWPANSEPMIYHATSRTGASGLAVEYKCFYTTVGV